MDPNTQYNYKSRLNYSQQPQIPQQQQPSKIQATNITNKLAQSPYGQPVWGAQTYGKPSTQQPSYGQQIDSQAYLKAASYIQKDLASKIHKNMIKPSVPQKIQALEKMEAKLLECLSTIENGTQLKKTTENQLEQVQKDLAYKKTQLSDRESLFGKIKQVVHQDGGLTEILQADIQNLSYQEKSLLSQIYTLKDVQPGYINNAKKALSEVKNALKSLKDTKKTMSGVVDRVSANNQTIVQLKKDFIAKNKELTDLTESGFFSSGLRALHEAHSKIGGMNAAQKIEFLQTELDNISLKIQQLTDENDQLGFKFNLIEASTQPPQPSVIQMTHHPLVQTNPFMTVQQQPGQVAATILQLASQLEANNANLKELLNKLVLLQTPLGGAINHNYEMTKFFKQNYNPHQLGEFLKKAQEVTGHLLVNHNQNIVPNAQGINHPQLQQLLQNNGTIITNLNQWTQSL